MTSVPAETEDYAFSPAVSAARRSLEEPVTRSVENRLLGRPWERGQFRNVGGLVLDDDLCLEAARDRLEPVE